MEEDKEMQAPRPVYQTPEWEGTTGKPRRKFNFAWPGVLGGKTSTSTTGPSTASAGTGIGAAATPNPALAKETLSSSADAPYSSVHPKPQGPTWRTRFDTLLPPHKTYLGRLTRRQLLLFVVLPLAILLLFIFPLALGLGLRNKSTAQNLPLPTGSGTIFEGELTYYNPGLGACGWTHGDDDPVCAVSHLLFDAVQQGSDPNDNSLCGKMLRVEREVDGVGRRSVDVMVVDRCTACAANDVDLSPAMFNRLAREEEGRVDGRWAWL